MTVTVVSACYGQYDAPIAPPKQDCDVRWRMVTDGLTYVPDPWEPVLEPRSHLHPRMAAKIPKCRPFEYADTDIAIWVDASATINRSDFVSMCVAALGDGDIAQWVHPERSCVEAEAFISAGMEKYASQAVLAQVAYYTKNGHPRSFGLWATGCMVWRRGPWNDRVGVDWLNEQIFWTYQDQLSWPVIVRCNDVDVRPLPGGLWDRTWLTFRPHASHA